MGMSCLNKALALLTRYNYSEYKLTKKLQEKEYDPEEIRQTIKKLKEFDYLNDVRTCRLKIKILAHRRVGEKLIFYRLKEEFSFLDADFIRQTLEEEHVDTTEILHTWLGKEKEKLARSKKNYSDYQIKNKLIAKAMQKGHSYEDIVAFFSFGP